jgi:5-oxoprolinase (ATP-hydrolysing) subunit A
MRTIDLNADLGEGYGPWRMGDDAAMLDIVTSANIACGGHASDPETMFATLTLAKAKGIVVGAHPSYPDKEGFGRRRLPYAPAEVSRFVAAQTGALLAIATLVGVRVAYVKPHGALANVAAEDGAIAEAIAETVKAIDPQLAILAISGTELEKVAKARGMQVFSEIYADRGYTKDGLLVPRSQPGALIDDAEVATARLLSWLETGKMQTAEGGTVALEGHSICIHGDSAHAVAMATHLKAALAARGLGIKPFLTAA